MSPFQFLTYLHLLARLGLYVFILQNLLTPQASANQYQYVGNPIAQIFSNEEHKSSNQIWWIEQYHDGKILFATGNGLTSWDGENWQQASTPNNTRVRDITVWKDNNIYAGAVGQLGYFAPRPSGEFEFTIIPTDHLIEDFGQTRGINSNQNIVVYSTDQSLFVWDGSTIRKVDDFDAKGSRVFNLEGELLVSDRDSFYSISITDQQIVISAKEWKFPPNLRIKSLFINQAKEIILVTNMMGVFQLKGDTFANVIAPEDMPITYLNSGIQAKDGFYYLNSTIDGVMVYSPAFELLRHYKQNDGIGLSTIYTIFQDNQENIWLGGLPNISVFQPPHLRSTYPSNTGTVDLENIFNLNGEMFFSGTGFYHLTFPNGYSRSPIFNQIADFNLVVLDMLMVGNELIVGTESGVYSFTQSKSLGKSTFSSPTLITSEDFVSDLDSSPDSRFIYTTIGNHLSQLEKVDGGWQEQQLEEDKSGTEHLMVQALNAQQHRVWFTTEQQELFQLTVESQSGKVGDKKTFNNKAHPLGNDHILPFMFGQRVMMGTQNGVIEYHTDASMPFSQPSDFPNALKTSKKDVFKITLDEEGRLWYHAGSDTGVMYRDQVGAFTVDESMFMPYNRSGTRGLVYFDKSIWLGTANGKIYRLSENTIDSPPVTAQVAIQYVNSISSDTRLPLNLNENALKVEDNSIRIGFALADYSTPRSALFRTKLIGQGNDNWTPMAAETNKDFTSLSGGDYSLHIEAQDPWGRLSTVNYDFSVDYPWYANYWARMFYLILLLLIIYLSIKLGQKLRNKTLEQQNRALEDGIQVRTTQIRQKVNELREQQELKDKFFANVSHEFRTPLTLTIGPLETILKEQKDNLNDQSKDLAITALSNAKTMLALVSQVLDINRLEVGKLSLRVSENDIAAMLRVNQQRFKPWAGQNSQTLVCINCENPLSAYCDQDQIDKCISNLLSNAIKYSGKNTTIKIELISNEKFIGIKITDDGYGIDHTRKNQVFERFYQENGTEKSIAGGTGIGLAIVKELVELHSGYIDLETDTNQGCQFTLWLPFGKEHFEEHQLIEPITINNAEKELQLDSIESSHMKILVVDDNIELRKFICQRLESSYVILEASDGQSGLVSAIKNMPDVIISDITMPVMNGIELTQKLKANPVTLGIPVLLLSAQATKRDIVTGFESGADDYLIKPFDTSELVMRVKSLIASRKLHALQKTNNAPYVEGPISQGESFEDNLLKHIFSNIHDTGFNIDKLAELMFMSKETLRRKCQAKYQKSPAAHIQEVRMQHAKMLLKEGKLNVSDVSYATGFDSLSYFSKTFKKYYGVSPSSLL